MVQIYFPVIIIHWWKRLHTDVRKSSRLISSKNWFPIVSSVSCRRTPIERKSTWWKSVSTSTFSHKNNSKWNISMFLIFSHIDCCQSESIYDSRPLSQLFHYWFNTKIWFTSVTISEFAIGYWNRIIRLLIINHSYFKVLNRRTTSTMSIFYPWTI